MPVFIAAGVGNQGPPPLSDFGGFRYAVAMTDIRPRWSLHIVNASLLLGAGLIVFIFVATAGFNSLELSIELTDQRRALRDNLIEIQGVLSDLKDLETGQRGFLITGDDIYLEPYHASRRGLDQRYRLMRSRVDDKLPQPEAFWSHLDGLIERRLQIAEDNVRHRREGSFDAHRDLRQLNEGRVAMDGLRQDFAGLEQRHRDAIGAWNLQVVNLRAGTRATTLSAGILGAVLIAGGLFAFLREQRHRQAAEAALRAANADLELQVQARTAELQQAMDRARVFAARLDQGIEDERRRLAREVHDQLGQFFTGLKLLTRGWSERVPDDPALREQLGRLAGLLDEGVATARRIASELRPPMLDDLGLGAALTHYTARAVAPAGIVGQVTLAHDRELSADQANALFRIAQEALTNTLRHAGAHHVRVYDRRDNGNYLFRIEDDGAGFAPDTGRGEGLMGMEERARQAGGHLELANTETGGARVSVRLSLTQAKEAPCER